MVPFVYFSVRQAHQNPVQPVREALKQGLPEWFSATIREQDLPNGRIAWCEGNSELFRSFRCPEGNWAFVAGEALASGGNRFLTPEEVLRIWQEDRHPEETLRDYSGLYCWGVLGRTGDVRIGVDPFGSFPIYWFQRNRSFGFSTSLRSLRQHPDYDSKPDPVGVMRALLENGISGERTLEHSGKRLAANSVLSYRAASNLTTFHDQGSPFVFPDSRIEDMDTAVALAYEAAHKAVERSTLRNPEVMLLSGGVDSRTILSLAHQQGIRPRCLIFGESTDFDAILARRVSRKLRLPSRIVDDSIVPTEELFADELVLHSLAAGVTTAPLIGAAALRTESATRALSGLIWDIQFSPYRITATDDFDASPDYCFDAWVNNPGVRYDDLLELTGPGEMREAAIAARDEILAAIRTLPDRPGDRVWMVLNRFRARTHLGGYMWKTAFASWPVTPALDLGLSQAIRRIHPRLFGKRAFQHAMLRTVSPSLARIPLAAMNRYPRPVIENLPNRFSNAWLKLQRATKGISRTDQLRFHRVLHLNSEPWSWARNSAEPHRETLHQFFDPGKLLDWLPPPDQAFPPALGETWKQGGQRLVLGLALWLGEYR